MKKFACAALAALALSVTSCGTYGGLYTDYVTAGTATSNTLGTKVGKAQRTAVLGLISTGNSGIQAAAKEAGIKKISHIDVQEFSVLGLFTTITTYVYGD